jgi:hypothetical protein
VLGGLCLAAFPQRLGDGYEFPKTMKGGTSVVTLGVFSDAAAGSRWIPDPR